MTLNEFGRFLNTKSIGRIEPPINEQLTERVYSAMKAIGHDTAPVRWVVFDAYGINILKRLDDSSYLRFPKKPILDSGEQLDIEDALIDALALYVISGLEPQRAKVNMGMYHGAIEKYNETLMSTYLQEASSDAGRFHVFP